MMKSKIALLSLGCGLLWVAGCSSIPLPSLPSMPSLSWSNSANKPDPTAEALFDEGMRYFNDKRYARAIDDFAKIKSDYPFSPLLLKTELQLADAYYLNQQYPEAINAFKEFESMHPTNENMPFVIYRLGQSYFDQFTTTDRDQKNTELAKTYFEAVLTKYPSSQYAADAKDKLAKCNGYLAEHNFNIAQFYLQQEKYPAARDRFEEIVRRYRGTPAAAKSLFFLGESYRKEKNQVKATLAYEALIQHYPDSPFAAQAQAQLAQIEKEKQDPLAMLLMRDRRPNLAVAQENGETKTAGKTREVDNLVAKTDMVYEEPGAEKGIFQRVVDKINPFSSSSGDKTAVADNKKSTDTTMEQLAKRKAAENKQESPGAPSSFWSSLNPFASKEAQPTQPETKSSVQLVQRIDDSLQTKGIDSKLQTAALTPPAADLPKIEEAPTPPPPSNTPELLGRIDSSLKKDGKSADALPPAPEEGQIFKDVAAAQERAAQAKANPQPAQSVASSGLLGAIDQKLQSQGVETTKIEASPVPSANAQANARKPEPTQKVELQSKVALESGPLFLSPAEVPAKTVSSEEQVEQDKKASDDKPQDSGVREIPKALIKGPPQPPAPTTVAKASDKKAAPASGDDEADKGMFDQLKQDAENISKILNPFSW
ncbi:MAG: outer membrane protein assembly factor BamD [Deltaproteobacteria bacterium]